MKVKFFTILCLLGLFAQGVSSQRLVPMHNDKGQFGYGIEGTKEFTIKPQWDGVGEFNDKGIAIVRKGQTFGLIDTNGKPVGKSMGYSVIANYDGTDLWLVAQGGKREDNVAKIKNRVSMCPRGFKGSLSYLINGAKWGLVTSDGKFKLEPKYQEISNIMGNGLIVVQEKNLLGIIDINGTEVFKSVYDAMTPINKQGVAAMHNKKTGKWSVISESGRTVIADMDKVNGFYQYENDVWGALNTVSADSLLKNKDLWAEPDRLMPIMTTGNSWINSNHPYLVTYRTTKQKKNYITEAAVFDLDGNEVVPFSAGVSYAGVPSDGISVVYRDDRCGFYDIAAKSFLPVDNRVYLPFRNGRSLSYSKDNSDFYIVDKTGNRVSDRYDEVSVAEDRFIVRIGSQYGLITRSGDAVIPVGCNELRNAGSEIFAVKNNDGAFGYVNKNGEVVVPFEYADGSNIVNDYAIVSKKVPGSFKYLSGVINLKNEIIVPLKFEKTIGGVGQDGRLSVWVLQDDVFSSYDLQTGKLTPTKYVDMKMTAYGTVTKDANGLCGLIVGNEEAIPCSLGDEDAVALLYSYMTSVGISSVTASEARSIAIKLDPTRNSFKLSDKISENYWDY